MTPDLVERLLGHDHRTGGDGRSIWAEAANEIERLDKVIAQQQVEIERLQAALNDCSRERDRWREESLQIRTWPLVADRR